MSTVDKAQGREYDFVLLDLVTPGGMFYPLGFSTGFRRMCVALSRAIIGMLIDQSEDGLLASSPDPANQDINMSETTRAKVIQLLHEQTTPKAFSLPAHISSRLALWLNNEQFPLEEVDVLRELHLARRAVVALNDDESETDDFKHAYRRFDNAWRHVQEYYILHEARGLIMTAATAMSPQIRVFRPHWLLIDEASQLTESATVAVISRFFSSLCKLVLLGDPKQRFPFCLAHLSEFIRTTMTSFMVRMISTGVPVTMLREQFRMHPHISDTVSRLFYSGLLRDSPGVLFQNEHRIWQRFHQQSLQECEMRHSIFVHVDTDKLYRTKKWKSLMNPSHLAIMPGAIDNMRRAGAREDQIAFKTPHKGQLLMIRNMGMQNDTSLTVDAAQGKEYDFVLLDLVTPGGGYGLGFVADVKRACVALSRARFGLVILGNRRMAEAKWPSDGTRNWGTVVSRHLTARGLLSVDASDQVEGLKTRQRIPGILCEEVEDRSSTVRS